MKEIVCSFYFCCDLFCDSDIILCLNLTVSMTLLSNCVSLLGTWL